MLDLLQHVLSLDSLLAQLLHFKLELGLEPALVLHVKLGRFQVLTDSRRLFLLLSEQELLLAYLIETLFRLGAKFLLNDHLALEVLLQLSKLTFEQAILLSQHLVRLS